MTQADDRPIDVVIVGAGAAGLATAIFARRLTSSQRVVLIDGARTPGAKILVSGGSRCNVTNSVVTERDFNGGRPASIRKVLRALPVSETIAFFQAIGVPLHEEPGGKLFPDTNRSRDVLDALLAEARRTGVEMQFGQRVSDISNDGATFRITTPDATLTARRLVIATGGLALPKSGSDGAGYGFAARLGHTIVPTTPALAPLLLDASVDDSHRQLSGVAQPVRIDVRIDQAIETRLEGALLWTHFGISGPAALDVSRHWHRARVERRDVALSLSLAPAARFEDLERLWIDLAREQQRATLQNVLARTLPASVAAMVLSRTRITQTQPLAQITRDDRRAAIHRLLEWPLPVIDSRGYTYAEVTAGGVALPEVNPATMESRTCKGLHLVGEVLDVDGRLGGFNFQWAWSSAMVTASALARTPL